MKNMKTTGDTVSYFWSLGRVTEYEEEWAEQNGGGSRRRQRIHKLAKLSVFFEVRRSSFHRHSEGGNNNKKQNKTNGKLNL